MYYIIIKDIIKKMAEIIEPLENKFNQINQLAYDLPSRPTLVQSFTKKFLNEIKMIIERVLSQKY